jgi:AcrR family transcriptional regulator
VTIRLTLPQQRAQETRQRVIDAARAVFAREGYGQAAVEEILVEAGISRGAFYHHFAGKEELFKALLADHLEEGLMEFEAIQPGSSLREAIEQFVTLQVHDLEAHLASGSLSFEFMAAAREEWARDSFAEFHRRTRDVIAGVLRAGQSAGAVRADLDVGAAAWLILGLYEGLSAFKALDPQGIELDGLKQTWADLIEKFVTTEGEVKPGKQQRRSRP